MEWISVEDKLPYDGERVLVFRKGFFQQLILWDYCDKETYTHWMPLPEPPKDGE